MFRSFVLLFCLALSFSSYADDSGVTVEMTPIKVSKHTYYVLGQSDAASSANQGFMSNAGFVVTSAGVVVFDTLGTPALAEKLIAEIKKITSQPIKLVIISHYHADHFYGTQAFKAIGAEVWAHKSGQAQLASDDAQLRLEQRRESLFPWVDENTKLLPADKWLDGDFKFKMGDVHFELKSTGPAHSPEDMAMLVKEDRVLFSGDLIFKGRVPFVGDADSRMWLKALDNLIAIKPAYLIPGHGEASSTPVKDLKLTRDYLTYVRKVMGKAVENFVPFDEAYAKADWQQFSRLPAFLDANRANAYNTYLLMEKEMLQ